MIVYDPDWNPHQDLQAIARVHRIGQTKPVRVFKLVTKSTCEERIMRDGQRKLGLDHLIIQRIDSAKQVVADDVASILDVSLLLLLPLRNALTIGSTVRVSSSTTLSRLRTRSSTLRAM